MPRASAPPALIDPPGPFATLLEWREFRDLLDRLDLPNLQEHKQFADQMIERLGRQPNQTDH